jgi:hypothetical protein
MKRKLFNFVSVLSLLLCVATVALWALGHLRFYGTWYSRTNYVATVTLKRGFVGLNVLWTYGDPNAYAAEPGFGWGSAEPGDPIWDKWSNTTKNRRFLGFQYVEYSYGALPDVGRFHTQTGNVLEVPISFLVLLFSLFPVGWLLDFRRRQKKSRQGLCHRCRYNLTGNTSGVCPECGTAVAGKVGK